jgi:hypothetical protein
MLRIVGYGNAEGAQGSESMTNISMALLLVRWTVGEVIRWTLLAVDGDA